MVYTYKILNVQIKCVDCLLMYFNFLKKSIQYRHDFWSKVLYVRLVVFSRQFHVFFFPPPLIKSEQIVFVVLLTVRLYATPTTIDFQIGFFFLTIMNFYAWQRQWSVRLGFSIRKKRSDFYFMRYVTRCGISTRQYFIRNIFRDFQRFFDKPTTNDDTVTVTSVTREKRAFSTLPNYLAPFTVIFF